MFVKTILVQALFSLFVGTFYVSSSPVICEDPHDLQETFRRLNSGMNITEFFFPPAKVETMELVDDDVLKFKSQRDSLYGSYGTDSCPTTVPIGDYPIELRSLCPWKYVVHHDPTIFPTTIPEAVPRCQNCVGLDGSKSCERIYRTITVLKQDGCIGGMYRYVQEQKSIVIGSVCAQRREVQSSSQVAPPPNIPSL